MWHKLLVGLVGMSVVAALVGFVLPWAFIDVHEPGALTQLRQTVPFDDTVRGLTSDLGRIAVKIRRGAETVTGELPSLSDIPTQVSGIRVPRLANQEKAQVVLALVELLTGQRQHIGLKSYAVYLLPGLALACGLLLLGLGGRQPAVGIGVGLVCAAIAGGGFWKLLTTDTQTLFIAITIGQGLWLSLWAYAGLAVSAALSVVMARGWARAS